MAILKRPRRRRLGYLNRYSRDLPVSPRSRVSGWSIITTILVVGIVGGLGWGVFYSPLFRINQVTIEGTTTVDVVQLQKDLHLEGQNLFRVKLADITAALKHYNVIDTYSLVRVLPHGVRIAVVERQPALLWQTAGKIWAIDGEGHSFKDVTAAPPAGATIVSDTTNIAVQVNEPVVPLTFIKTFTLLQGQLLTIYQEPVKSYEVGETVYDLDAIMNDGRRVRFNILSDIAQQLSDLKRLATDRPDLFKDGYIDLRVDRWAYVK